MRRMWRVRAAPQPHPPSICCAWLAGAHRTRPLSSLCPSVPRPRIHLLAWPRPPSHVTGGAGPGPVAPWAYTHGTSACALTSTVTALHPPRGPGGVDGGWGGPRWEIVCGGSGGVSCIRGFKALPRRIESTESTWRAKCSCMRPWIVRNCWVTPVGTRGMQRFVEAAWSWKSRSHRCRT